MTLRQAQQEKEACKRAIKKDRPVQVFGGASVSAAEICSLEIRRGANNELVE